MALKFQSKMRLVYIVLGIMSSFILGYLYYSTSMDKIYRHEMSLSLIHISGEASVTAAGGVKADMFVSGTNIIEYKDLNGSYALMDLNGNLLTESIYGEDMMGRGGYIIAELNDGSGKSGILAPVSYTHLDVYKRQALQRRTALPLGK